LIAPLLGGVGGLGRLVVSSGSAQEELAGGLAGGLAGASGASDRFAAPTFSGAYSTEASLSSSNFTSTRASNLKHNKQRISDVCRAWRVGGWARGPVDRNRGSCD